MPLDFVCSVCGKPLEEPGAIVLSPPHRDALDTVNAAHPPVERPTPHSVLVWKDHVCIECHKNLLKP